MVATVSRESAARGLLIVLVLSHLLEFEAFGLRREETSEDAQLKSPPRPATAPADGRSSFSGNGTSPPPGALVTKASRDGPLASLLTRVDGQRDGQNSSTIGGGGGQQGGTLQIQVTAIHVDKSEFPLSKLLFKLTLRLALSEASRLFEREQAPAATQLQHWPSQEQARSQALAKVKLELSVRSANTCSRQYAAALAAEEFYVRRSRLFVVSGCDDAIRSVSRLASQWRVPIMTAAGFGADLNDKTVHRTLIRVAFSLRAAVEFLFKIIKSFQWRRVNLIVDESDANSLALRGSIEQHVAKATTAGADQPQVGLNTVAFDLQALLRNNRAAGDTDDEFEAAFSSANSSASSRGQPADQQPDEDRWPNELTQKVIQDALWQSSTYSRVTILLIPAQYLRKFMLSVYDQHMANGLYTFINMPLLAQEAPAPGGADQPDATGESVFLWRSLRSRRNAQAKQAFESLMSIYLRTPTTKAYVYFASKLTELANANVAQASAFRRHHQPDVATSSAAKRPLGFNNSATPPPRRVQLNTNPYSASFYDGIQIYASALNESLHWARYAAQANASEWDLHARISELVRKRRFDNMVTGNIYINSNGDRDTDYTLDDMNQMTGKFSPVILYRGETRDIERLNRIHWSSDGSVGPTSDLVDCTLLGTCVSKPMTRFTLVLVLLAGPLVFILAGAFYFVHNKLSLESQLVDHWWKIHLSEIEIVLTRRKNANDGSLVLQQSEPGAHGSVASSQEHSTQADGQKTAAGAAANRRLAAAAKSRRSASGSIIGAGAGAAPATCDKTEVTKATDASATWASTVMDVCYGNITLAIYKLSKVALRPLAKFHQSRKLMIELRNLKEINHNNLCRFVGILVDEGSLAIVSEFCPKGSLREFFHNESMVIDWTFKYSIINDIMAGLLYLHASSLGFHGRLKSSNCLVSGRFVVKLSDYGPHSLYEQLDEELDRDSDEWLQTRLWLAPEHMKAAASKLGSMRGDVYSFGLLLYEIITNSLPFFDVPRDDFVLPLKPLHQELRGGRAAELMEPFVAAILEAEDEGDDQRAAAAAAAVSPLAPHAASIRPLVDLMQTCWRPEPAKRPSSTAVNAALKRITRGVTPKKLLENLTGRMEQYTNNLESLVEAKLACLLEEKQRAEELLYQFVPKSIASLLKEGQFVEPEAFECVTVFYSDIVGFTSLSSESSPMEVVDLLSDLYLCFDSTLEQHDIFKVDTIGDAYIVASGLPQRNEGKHVIEIACAALELRDRLQRFRIPHKPERQLEMRVGIHSGACIAGIVGGLQMPKYCVFGDTLTTGKFMESSGLPMKIHITEQSRALLQNLPDFAIEPRQPKITRDGLPFQTYWLERAPM